MCDNAVWLARWGVGVAEVRNKTSARLKRVWYQRESENRDMVLRQVLVVSGA
jgi:hypothetical protein